MAEEKITGEVINRVLPPVGLHKAYVMCVAVMGKLEEEYEGHKKRVLKVLLGFELVDHSHVWDPAKGPEVMVHWQKFTLMMGTKATLRKLLDGLKGTAMTDAEAKEFNIGALLGCCLNVNLIKKVSGKGNERIEVQSLIGMNDKDSDAMPPMINKEIFFTLAAPFKTEAYNMLPKWAQKEITTSEEYMTLYPTPGAAGPGQNPAANTTTTNTTATPAAKKKNVPF